MSSIQAKDDISLLNHLIEVLKSIDLDINWLLAVSSLAAQEIAVKKKLDELGIKYGDEDFQKIVEELIKTMEMKQIQVPEILLSISRSYRHIRAKLLHAPHKTKLSHEEAKAIFNNTEALIKVLFKKTPDEYIIQKFVESLNKLSLDEALKSFESFDIEIKKHIFRVIADKILVLNWDELEGNEHFFEFLESSLRSQRNLSEQIELFDILLQKTITKRSFAYEKLMEIIAKLTQLTPIKDFIRDRGYVDLLINEFEASDNFNIASINARIMLNLSSIFTKEQLCRIMKASLSNDQILYSWGARTSLKKLFMSHKEKIPSEKLKEWEEKFKE